MTLPNPTLAPLARPRSGSVVEPGTVEVTEADVLLRAADLLEEFGWCQGHAGSKREGEFCARGAIIEAHRDLTGERLDLWGDATTMGYDNFVSRNLGLSKTLCAFNDSLGRTKAEVTAALRSAALSGMQ